MIHLQQGPGTAIPISRFLGWLLVRPRLNISLITHLWAGNYKLWAWLPVNCDVPLTFNVPNVAGMTFTPTLNGPLNPAERGLQGTLQEIGVLTVEKDNPRPEIKIEVTTETLQSGSLVLDDLFLTIEP